MTAESINGKKIAVGVAGGIAAYKAAQIVRLLKKSGAEVQVFLTRAAENFITPLTLRELSGRPVITSMWRPVTQWEIEHIAAANWADAFLLAPATANLIGKLAGGIADDMLTTTLLATRAPVFFAPAMNTNMYLHPLVQKNMRIIESLGYHKIEAASGPLACGVEGVGRLAEPEKLVERLDEFFAAKLSLRGKKVLVTAAGTIEPIDPVRYIGNRSSGKMGYAIAAEAKRRGASVALVSGPSALDVPPGVAFHPVETARQMQEIVLREFDDADITIKAAAVADYRAKEIAPEKIKKRGETLVIELEKNPDILLELGKRKKKKQILIGFAAETQHLIEYATEKLRRKNLDFIIANDVSQKGAGFNSDTNIVKLLYPNGAVESYPLTTKAALAGMILDKIAALVKN